MIKLYQFEPAWGLPSPSPFCMKLETYLRMAEISYEIIPHADIRKSPKGKMPYIEHEGQLLGDSGLIIEYLQKIFGDKLDQNLTRSEHAISLAIRRLVEENLYWVGIYSRWAEQKNWKMVKSTFFGFLPPVVRTILPEILRRRVLNHMYGHGIGRHKREEIYHIGKTDLSALSVFLGDKAFFMGESPTSIDATVYGFLANVLWTPIESPLKEHGKNLENLPTYCNRMKERFYRDS